MTDTHVARVQYQPGRPNDRIVDRLAERLATKASGEWDAAPVYPHDMTDEAQELLDFIGHARAIEVLLELKDSLPHGHQDKVGIIRAIELLRSDART